MRANRVSLAASLLALPTAVGALVVAWQSEGTLDTPAIVAASRLDARLRVLEEQVNRLARLGTAPPGPAPADRLDNRLAHLEDRVLRMEGEVGERRRDLIERESKRLAELTAAHETALNRTATTQARLEAMGKLRQANERTLEEALAMVELIQRPETAPDVRADLVTELRGLTFPELKAPLLALSTDPYDDTRERSVAALAPFVNGDPALSEFLTRVSREDHSDEVRREARRALESAAGAPPQGQR